jgi:hypothetical protein
LRRAHFNKGWFLLINNSRLRERAREVAGVWTCVRGHVIDLWTEPLGGSERGCRGRRPGSGVLATMAGLKGLF